MNRPLDKNIKHLNVEVRQHVVIAREGIIPQFAKVSPHFLWPLVTYPVVVVEVDGIRCRALLDTGGGSSYASATLLTRLDKQPVRKEYRRIEMMIQSSTKMIEVHKIKINSIEEVFNLETEVSKVDREVLLYLNNPRYKEMMAKYPPTQGN